MTYRNPCREPFLKGQSNDALRAKQARDTNADIIAKLNIHTPDKAIKEVRRDRNNFVLSAGDFKIGALDGDVVVITGNGDSRITTPVTVNSKCAIFNNVSFVGDGVYLAKVKNDASAIFNGCTFERSKMAATSNTASDDLCYVLVNETARAAFVGCAFLKGSTFSGYVIINEGPDTTNVQLLGCQNLTGTEI
jgi:hypothetical protein